MPIKKQTIYQILIIILLITFPQFILLATTPLPKLPDHQITQLPKKGFVPLFNGKDLTGWKGLVGDPVKRSQMSPDDLAKEQAKADSIMRSHWKVEDGILILMVKVSNIFAPPKIMAILKCWSIGRLIKMVTVVFICEAVPRSKSGILPNGPKVRADCTTIRSIPANRLKCADKPIGEWNTFRIRMIDDRVTVYLNGELVVDNVVMENYWERHKPIYPTGQIELQAHKTPLYFRNIFIKEIPRKNDWRPLFNGKNFEGWTGATDGYLIEDGKIVCPEHGGGNLFSVWAKTFN